MDRNKNDLIDKQKSTDFAHPKFHLFQLYTSGAIIKTLKTKPANRIPDTQDAINSIFPSIAGVHYKIIML